MEPNGRVINTVYGFEEYIDKITDRYDSEAYIWKWLYRFNESYETEGNVPFANCHYVQFYTNGAIVNNDETGENTMANPELPYNAYIALADNPVKIPLENNYSIKIFDNFTNVMHYKNWDFSRLDCRELNVFMMAMSLKDDWMYPMNFKLLDFLENNPNTNITKKSVTAMVFMRNYSRFQRVKHYRYENLCERCKLDFETAETQLIHYNRHEIQFNFENRIELYNTVFTFRFQLFCNRCGKCLFLIKVYDEKNNVYILC